VKDSGERIRTKWCMHFNCFGRWKIIFNKHLWYRTDCCKVFLSVPLSVCLSVCLSLSLFLSVSLSFSVCLYTFYDFIHGDNHQTILQYNCTLYRNHEGLGFLALKYHRKTSFNICFVTSRQHWLSKSKVKNVFISTINLSTELIWNF